MIEFNLLPKEVKGVRIRRVGLRVKLPKIAPAPLIVSVISVLILSQATLGFLAVRQRGRLIRLSAEFNEISSQEEMASALKREADELNRKFSVIDSLTSGSLVWARKLYDLNQSLVEGAWLTSLSLEEEQPQDLPGVLPRGGSSDDYARSPARQTLVLKGSVISPSPGGEPAIIGKFIESLKNNQGFFADFEDIKLSSINRKKMGAIEVMDFTIVSYFKSGRSYFEKLEATDI